MTTETIQRSPEWRAARCGSLGASQVADALARTKSGWGASRATVMSQLLLERITGQPTEGYVSAAMQAGIDNEAAARSAYCFFRDTEVIETGIHKHPRIKGTHSSPDGLVGSNGALEIKCRQAPAHLEVLLSGKVSQREEMQCAWVLATTGRDYARQAEDETLLKHAMRIQGRAVRRAGELLETFKNERARTDLHEGTLTQKKAAETMVPFRKPVIVRNGHQHARRS